MMTRRRLVFVMIGMASICQARSAVAMVSAQPERSPPRAELAAAAPAQGALVVMRITSPPESRWKWFISPVLWCLTVAALGLLVRKSNTFAAKLCLGGALLTLVGEFVVAGRLMHHGRRFVLDAWIHSGVETAAYASAIGQAAFAIGLLVFIVGLRKD